MTKSKKLTFKLFRGQNVSTSRGENEQAGGAKNEKSISEAARLLDKWEYSHSSLKVAKPLGNLGSIFIREKLGFDHWFVKEKK